MEGRIEHGRSDGTATRHLRRALLVLGLLGLGAALVMQSASATGARDLVRVGARPRLPRGAVDLGAAPAGERVSGALVLRPRDEAALEGFIAAATTRGSPAYGHYLAPEQFAARFGPAPASVAAARAALAQSGLQVQSSGSPLLVRFGGSAAAAERAFATSLHRVALRGRRTGLISGSAPALPAQLAGSVAAVVGLDQLPAPRPRRAPRIAAEAGSFPAATAVGFAHPPGAPDACSQARADARQFGGLTDDEIANAYGAFGLYSQGDTGSGVHIGVFEQEAFSYADLRHFDGCYFGAAGAAAMRKRLHVVALEGGIPQGPGEFGEALLDVEDVSAMAPGAEIDVYENPETAGGEVAEIAAMVDEDRDQIITSSYGQACEQEEEEGQPGTQQALNFLFQQGAAQGQTFLGAAGDNGSDSCEEAHREPVPQPGQNPVSAGEIASQPYVIGVGGTTITRAAQPIREHVWNDGGFGGAGGGGISQSFAMPSWQRDATVPGIEEPGSKDYENAARVEQRFGYPTGFCQDTLPTGAGTACRLEPDVSAQSDEFTGAVTVYSEQYRGSGEEEEAPDGWITSGGTSSGTPIWAGLLALVDASPTCRDDPATAAGAGFMLPLLYGVASNASSYAASFNDITEGDNDQYGLDAGKVFPARRGYDLASGLGSPRLTGPRGSAGLAYYLCSYGADPGRPIVSELSPGFASVAGGGLLKISGANLGEVASVQIGAWQTPPGSVQVLGPGALSLTLPPARLTLPAHAPAGQDGAGPVPVIVTLTDGQSSAAGPASTFHYLDTSDAGPAPSVAAVLPTGGSETAPEPVTVLGSGFAHAGAVSFGGVDAARMHVLSDSEILVTPPAYSGATACAPLPATGVYAGEGPANDICQVQVVVHLAGGGTSAGEAILPPFEGSQSFEQDGALKAPPGCGCELYPQPSEYDYAPGPQISSVSTAQGPASLASESGGTLVTIRGSGLGRFTYDYASFGEAQLESSIDFAAPAYISGTEIQIEALPLRGHEEEPTLQAAAAPLSVRTLAGASAPASVEYAGVPRVMGVLEPANPTRLGGLVGAADTGGTQLQLKGTGLAGQVAFVRFSVEEGSSTGSDHELTEEGPNRLGATTVAEPPALVQVQACTASGCSTVAPADRLYLYPPGRPAVEHLTPAAGRAAGGTSVRIVGENLGCPLGVGFGHEEAQSFAPAPGSACGEPGAAVVASSPPGAPGSEVQVQVSTWESYFTGSGDAATTPFRYR